MKTETKLPNNAKELAVAKLNPEFWSNRDFPSRLKSQDTRLQGIQMHINRANTAAMRITDQLYTAPKEVPKSLRLHLISGLLTLSNNLALAQSELYNQRRWNIRRGLSKEFSTLNSTDKWPKGYLFGDDLEKALKTAKTSSSVIRSAVAIRGRQTHHPYNGGRGSFRSRSGNGSGQNRGRGRFRNWNNNRFNHNQSNNNQKQ